MVKNIHLAAALGLSVCALSLSACHEEGLATYDVTVTNLTHAQPLSPLAVVLHEPAYSAWRGGEAASEALELLAESGDNSALLDEASAHDEVEAVASGTGVIAPGASQSLSLRAEAEDELQLMLAGMLVNTNDAFAGIDALGIGQLATGQSLTRYVPAYDAGTEANTESAASVPGPAGGGEGFNVARDDKNRVVIHPGVVSQDDGLTGSALGQAHRFDNPVLRIVVRRSH